MAKMRIGGLSLFVLGTTIGAMFTVGSVFGQPPAGVDAILVKLLQCIDKTEARNPELSSAAAKRQYMEELRLDWDATIGKEPSSFANPAVSRLHESIQFYFGGRTTFSKPNIDTMLIPPSPLQWYGMEEKLIPELTPGGLQLRLAWLQLFSELFTKEVLDGDRDLRALGTLMNISTDFRKNDQYSKVFPSNGLPVVVKAYDAVPRLTRDELAELASIHQKSAIESDRIEQWLKKDQSYKGRADLYQSYLQGFASNSSSPYYMLFQRNPKIFEDRISACAKVLYIQLQILVASAALAEKADAERALQRINDCKTQLSQLDFPRAETVTKWSFSPSDVSMFEEIRGHCLSGIPEIKIKPFESDLPLDDISGISTLPRMSDDEMDRLFRVVFDYQKRCPSATVASVLQSIQEANSPALSNLFKRAYGK